MIIVPYASSDVLALAENKNVKLEFHPIAAEALVFITPVENDAGNITMEQIRNIYLNYGIKNWSSLGGSDRELIPICRNSDSGSQSQMDNLVLMDKKMHPAIMENYVELTFEGVAPTEETIADGSYSLSDSYYAVIRNDLPEEHSARNIIDWLKSDAGKTAIRNLGLIPRK